MLIYLQMKETAEDKTKFEILYTEYTLSFATNQRPYIHTWFPWIVLGVSELTAHPSMVSTVDIMVQCISSTKLCRTLPTAL